MTATTFSTETTTGSHPDANVEAAKAEDFAAAERFKKITEAYTVLSDLEKRALYDRYGESWREAEKKSRLLPARSRARSVPTRSAKVFCARTVAVSPTGRPRCAHAR